MKKKNLKMIPNSFYSFDLKLFNPFEETDELKDNEMNF